MKYNYTFFHEGLLNLKNLNYHQYQYLSDLDYFVLQLSSEDVFDYTEIQWDAFFHQMDIHQSLERFIGGITSPLVCIKALLYLQRHSNIIVPNNPELQEYIETICARYISEKIPEASNMQFHGFYHAMPPLNLHKWMSYPNIFTEKTPKKILEDNQRLICEGRVTIGDLFKSYWNCFEEQTSQLFNIQNPSTVAKTNVTPVKPAPSVDSVNFNTLIEVASRQPETSIAAIKAFLMECSDDADFLKRIRTIKPAKNNNVVIKKQVNTNSQIFAHVQDSTFQK